MTGVEHKTDKSDKRSIMIDFEEDNDDSFIDQKIFLPAMAVLKEDLEAQQRSLNSHSMGNLADLVDDREEESF